MHPIALGSHPRRARIVGAGAYVPEVRMSTERIARLFPGWSPERIVDRTGILERRYLWDLDDATGKGVAPPRDGGDRPASGVDMAEAALRRSLRMAGLAADTLDALFVVTCTPDQPSFSHDAMLLHRRLGCRPDCYALVIDSGCGGSMYLLDMASRMVASGAIRTAAVVATNFTSSMVDRDLYTGSVPIEGSEKSLGAFLSAYVFGDGAGAVVLQAGDDPDQGVLASVAGNEHLDLVLKPGGGALLPSYAARTRQSDLAFIVNGSLVQQSYLKCMARSIGDVLASRSLAASDVRRYYLHQPNQRLFDHFIASIGLRPEQAPSNVALRGNTSAAGMFILLAEDLERGDIALGSGELVVLAAIGAGAHHGAQLARL